MASRFVSAGTIDASGGEAVPDAAAAAAEGGAKPQGGAGPPLAKSERGSSRNNNEEWEAVQRDLEAERRRREEARRAEGAPGAERSLFEVLQANKGAFGLFLERDLVFVAGEASVVALGWPAEVEWMVAP